MKFQENWAKIQIKDDIPYLNEAQCSTVQFTNIDVWTTAYTIKRIVHSM